MTLKDCTKEELMWIIKRMTIVDDYYLKRALSDLEYERVKKKLAEAERWGQVADDCRTKYIAILKKYEGKSLLDIPTSEIQEAERLLKDALDLIKSQKAVIEELGKRTNIKKVILPFINEKGELSERIFNVDINCLEEGDSE